MAFSHGRVAQFFLSGFNATGYLSDVSESRDVDTAETTTLGNTDKSYIAGLVDSSVSASGNLDYNVLDDTTTFVYLVQSLVNETVPMVYIPQSGVEGDLAYLSNGVLTSHNISTSVGDKASVDLEFQNTGVNGVGLRAGVTHKALQAETISDETASIDGTSSSAFGGQAILSVTTASGTTPTLDVKVQHSVDDSVWVDLITFTQATGRTGEYQAVTGTVNRYTRVLWTIAGTGPSFTFHVAWKRNLS